MSWHHQSDCCDGTAGGPAYHTGDYAWLHRPKSPSSASHKPHTLWQCPFIIVCILSPPTYLIRGTGNPGADVPTVLYSQFRLLHISEEAQVQVSPAPLFYALISEQRRNPDEMDDAESLQSVRYYKGGCHNAETVRRAFQIFS
ncbi:hypothetical protein AHF37_03895 [Paragonimus kellicotti]|nr:hypothetical protein AHF37_03895 [Paragonimus kellicotti]